MFLANDEKRFLIRSRLTMASLYAICLCLLSLAAFAQEVAGFRITQAEAEAKISAALVEQGIGENVQATLTGRRSDDLIQRSEPIVMDIVSIQPDTTTKRFTATLSFASEAQVDKPSQRYGNLQVSGRFDEMQDVPVMKSRMSQGTVIREEDLTLQKMPAERVAREAVLDMAEIIGKTPTRMLAPNRPIKASELQVPPVVNRQSSVHLSYKSAHITIAAVGTALQSGAVGDKIRVRNDSSGNTVEGIVTAPGQVQVLPAPMAMRTATVLPAAQPAEPVQAY